MTRINLVPVEELTDQHLIAEYREIFMVGPSLQRSLRSKKGFDKNRIPKQFTLNKGHVMFFYDKGKYLNTRYQELIFEMKNRGMNPDPLRIFNIGHFPPEYYNDWVPGEEDFKIIRARISERIQLKPSWYRKTPHVG